jgi:hypothetical protein
MCHEEMELHGKMTVGVAKDSPMGEFRHSELRLLDQFPTRGVQGQFSRLDLPTGELPEPMEKARRVASLDQPAAGGIDRDHGADDVRPPGTGPTGR